MESTELGLIQGRFYLFIKSIGFGIIDCFKSVFPFPKSIFVRIRIILFN